jgi:hypothetical protein
VSDKDTPSSGSRWEPANGAAGSTVPQPERTPDEALAADDAATEHLATPAAMGAAPASAGEPTRPRRARHRGALAAAGVGLVLAGGVGGFAIAHAVAGTEVSDTGTITDPDQDGFPGGPPDGGRGGRTGFDRDGTGPGQSTPGSDDQDADDGGTG